jgi:hypothetical protein
MFATKLLVATVGVSLIGMSMSPTADAAPVTYAFTSGYVTLSADIGGVDYLPAGQEIPLTGTQVTFDAAAISVTSFQFADAGPSTVDLTGPYSGLDVTISGWTLGPGTGYTTISGSGTNPYNFTVGPVASAGNYSLSGTVTRGSTAFSAMNPVLSGAITLGSTDSLQLTGITIGTFTADGQTVTIKGDVVFDGATAVPLPAPVWLLGAGLAVFGTSFVKRRGSHA